MLSSVDRVRPLFIFCLVALFVGCAVSNAPKGWLDTVEKKTESGFGGWVKIWLESDSSSAAIGKGELLTISDDSLFWFDESTVRAVAKTRIKRLKLELYKSDSGKLAGWTLGGTLSTASHGLLAGLTAPLWLLTGVAATAAASNDPMENLSRNEIEVPGDMFWKKIRKGARFPAGFPKGLDRSSLSPKPESPHVRRVKHNEFKD